MNETNYSEFVSDLQDMVETAYSDVRQSLLRSSAEDFQNDETSRKETRDDKHEATGDYQSIKGNYRGWGL